MLSRAVLPGLAALALALPVGAAAPRPGMIVVVHPNAYYPWVATSRKPGAGFEDEVIRRCGAVMGKGCAVLFRLDRGTVALARREDGTGWYGRAETSAEAQRLALAECRANNKDWLNLDCEIEAVYPLRDPGSRVRIDGQADPARTRGRFGAIAFHRQGDGTLRLWVTAGRVTPEFSNGDALANCQAHVGQPCKLMRWGINAYFMVYSAGEGRVFVNQGRTESEATARMNRFCQAKGYSCKIEFGVNGLVEETSEYTVAR